jgi:hypothetical protein
MVSRRDNIPPTGPIRMLRLGMLTPSSNTVLEPVSARIVAALPQISLHASRFHVTQIGLDATAIGQFDDAPILAAAELLAHAKVDVIAWNGTSASWLGLDRDRDLVARIEAATGIPASTCMLGFFDLFRALGVKRLGLVTPYTRDVQEKIAAVYAGEGVEVVSERHLGIRRGPRRRRPRGRTRHPRARFGRRHAACLPVADRGRSGDGARLGPAVRDAPQPGVTSPSATSRAVAAGSRSAGGPNPPPPGVSSRTMSPAANR